MSVEWQSLDEPAQIASGLSRFPSKTRLEIHAEGDNGSHRLTGHLKGYDQDVPARTVESDDQEQIYVMHMTVEDGVKLTEITPKGPNKLGEVVSISLSARPYQIINITDLGIEIPTSLVGYSSSFKVLAEDGESGWVYFDEPGLRRYDNRLLAVFDEVSISPPYTDETVTLITEDGVEIDYLLFDTRSVCSPTPPAESRYRAIDAAITELDAISRAIADDSEITAQLRTPILRTLADIRAALMSTRVVLLECPPSTELVSEEPSAIPDRTQYETILKKVRTRCVELAQEATADSTLSELQLRRAHTNVNTALYRLAEVRSWLWSLNSAAIRTYVVHSETDPSEQEGGDDNE